MSCNFSLGMTELGYNKTISFPWFLHVCFNFCDFCYLLIAVLIRRVFGPWFRQHAGCLCAVSYRWDLSARDKTMLDIALWTELVNWRKIKNISEKKRHCSVNVWPVSEIQWTIADSYSSLSMSLRPRLTDWNKCCPIGCGSVPFSILFLICRGQSTRTQSNQMIGIRFWNACWRHWPLRMMSVHTVEMERGRPNPNVRRLDIYV